MVDQHVARMVFVLYLTAQQLVFANKVLLEKHANFLAQTNVVDVALVM